MAYVHILHEIYFNGVSVVKGAYSSNAKARKALGEELDSYRDIGYGVSDAVVDMYRGRQLYYCIQSGDSSKRYELGENDYRYWIEKVKIE